MKKILIWFVSLLFLLPVLVSAQTYYVDKNSASCNDGGAGTSLSAPWCTIGKANQALQAGDTVYIRTGTYTEQYDGMNLGIFPENSGVDGAPITYQNYNGEQVVIADVYIGAEIWHKDYIILDGLEFNGRDYNDPTMEHWVLINGNHNIVRNCKGFHSGYTAGLWIYPDAGYNKILNSQWAYTGKMFDWWVPGADENPTPETYPMGETIRFEGHHTLFEGNTVWWGGHNVLGIMPDADATYNVIRGNEFYNPIYRAIGWGRANTNPVRVVFEDNIIRNCERGYWGPSPGIQINGYYSIMRRNRLYANDGPGIFLTGWTSNGDYYLGSYTKIYNNVFYGNGRNTWRSGPSGGIQIRLSDTEEILQMGVFEGVAIKNNIAVDNSGPGIEWGFDENRVDFDVTNNHLDENGDPLFIDSANADFRLQANSPAINAGTFLTKTSSSGSGTQIGVADAGYFMDGFGIVEGDVIQLEGQSVTARIVGVDYDNNILTLNRTLTWTSGQGVSLSYTGSAPDIGAYEYESQPQTCTGTCKPNACTSYNNCTGVTGTCSSGYYCCSGTCTTPSQTCTDGTAYGQCSSNKPKYCDNGNLVNRCSQCGCPGGYNCQADDSCQPSGNVTGPVAWYRFDEGSGAVAADSSGKGNDGSIYGATWTSGVSGNALNFDGIDDFVNTNTDFSWSTVDSFSIDLWVKPSSVSTKQGVMGKGAAGGYGDWNWEWQFRLTDYSQNIEFIYYDVTGNYNEIGLDGPALTPGEWAYVAVTYNPTDKAKMYHNGELVSTNPDVTNPFQDQNTPVLIGHSYFVGGDNYYFNGTIDNVRIYSRALGTGDITQHYNDGINYLKADTNDDGYVDIADLAFVTAHFGEGQTHPQWNAAADMVQNGRIDIYDMVFVASRFS